MCVFNTGSGCLSSTCASGQVVKALSLADTGDMIRIRFFIKEELVMAQTTDGCASVRERTLLLERCVFACLFPELTNCTKVNSGAPAPIVALAPTHTHTPFP